MVKGGGWGVGVSVVKRNLELRCRRVHFWSSDTILFTNSICGGVAAVLTDPSGDLQRETA